MLKSVESFVASDLVVSQRRALGASGTDGSSSSSSSSLLSSSSSFSSSPLLSSSSSSSSSPLLSFSSSYIEKLCSLLIGVNARRPGVPGSSGHPSTVGERKGVRSWPSSLRILVVDRFKEISSEARLTGQQCRK